VFANPVEEGALEAYVMAESFGLQPLVLQDFLTLGEELLVEARLLHEFPGRLFGLRVTGRMHSDHGDCAARTA
jgi:hypothetical protein